jgi:hypothetical protein
MNNWHALLARQLKKSFGDEAAVPEDIQGFLRVIDAAYRQSDDDRAMLLRATTQELGTSREDVLNTVTARLDLSRKVADEAYGGRILSRMRSIWGTCRG